MRIFNPFNPVGLTTPSRYRNYGTVLCWCVAWQWEYQAGQKMINKVASSFQVERRVQCMGNCSVSPICDSFNYHPASKTCQLNTHDTPLVANLADMVVDWAWGWGSPVFCYLV